MEGPILKPKVPFLWAHLYSSTFVKAYGLKVRCYWKLLLFFFSFKTIFMSTGAPSGGLQYVYELQRQKNKLSKSQNVQKNPLDPPLLSNPISSFLSMLRNLKSYGCINWRSTKTLWIPKARKQCPNILHSKSQTILTHPSQNINPPYFETLYFLHFSFFFSDIHGCKCIKWVITRSLNSKNNERMPKDFKLVDTLNVHSSTYLCCSQQHHNLSNIHENVGLFGI